MAKKKRRRSLPKMGGPPTRMAKGKPNLPAAVHDHFRKANILHTYVQKELGEATKHALEIGQELQAAKKTIPHGSWEDECKRLFDGSPRTAQFYMQFAKDVSTLPKAQASAVLLLEGTLDGAAKAAKKAATPKPSPPKKKKAPPPEPDEPIDAHSEPVDDSNGDFEEGSNVDSEPIDDSGYEVAAGVLAMESPCATPPTAYCQTCKVDKAYDGDGACVVCREPGIGPAASREPADGKPSEEPEAAESAGTHLRNGVLLAINYTRERFPDIPDCLVGSILESLAVTWKSELED